MRIIISLQGKERDSFLSGMKANDINNSEINIKNLELIQTIILGKIKRIINHYSKSKKNEYRELKMRLLLIVLIEVFDHIVNVFSWNDIWKILELNDIYLIDNHKLIMISCMNCKIEKKENKYGKT